MAGWFVENGNGLRCEANKTLVNKQKSVSVKVLLLLTKYEVKCEGDQPIREGALASAQEMLRNDGSDRVSECDS